MGIIGNRRKKVTDLTISAEKYTRDINSSTIDIEHIIKNEGIVIEYKNLPSEISGLLTSSNNKDWIVQINKNHHKNRQRFTLAHEFAHYCLHRYSYSEFEDTTFFRANNDSIMENEANRFASELLMPEDKIRSKISAGCVNLSEMAIIFEVSILAMKYRLENLGYKIVNNEK